MLKLDSNFLIAEGDVFWKYIELQIITLTSFWKIRHQQQQVALEVLSYHNASSMNEVDDIVKAGVPPEDPEIARSG